jgi:hypothetical protein
MRHEQEIEAVAEQVKPWPAEERTALAYRILHDARTRTRQPAPRNTADEAFGIASGDSPPPDDATVRRWMEEHRLEKYG